GGALDDAGGIGGGRPPAGARGVEASGAARAVAAGGVEPASEPVVSGRGGGAGAGGGAVVRVGASAEAGGDRVLVPDHVRGAADFDGADPVAGCAAGGEAVAGTVARAVVER